MGMAATRLDNDPPIANACTSIPRQSDELIATVLFFKTTLNKKIFVASLVAGAAGIFMGSNAANAERQRFEATCVDASKCTVTVDGEQLKTSRGLQINAEDVVYWSVSDNTKKKSLGWCFLVGVNCYPREDVRFMIKYMDSDGRRQITQIGFFNRKPARAFASYLSVFSGLESGQIAGLSNSSNRTAALAPESVDPYTDVTTSLDAKPKGRQHVADPYGSTPAVRYDRADAGGRRTVAVAPPKNCWTKYLEANPAMKVWADANPGPAAQTKDRYDDC